MNSKRFLKSDFISLKYSSYLYLGTLRRIKTKFNCLDLGASSKNKATFCENLFFIIMPNHCVVPGCREYGNFSFPSDPAVHLEWRIAINRMEPDGKTLWKPSPHSKVCARHFKNEDFKTPIDSIALRLRCTGKKPKRMLKEGVVPSIFPLTNKMERFLENCTVLEEGASLNLEDIRQVVGPVPEAIIEEAMEKAGTPMIKPAEGPRELDRAIAIGRRLLNREELIRGCRFLINTGNAHEGTVIRPIFKAPKKVPLLEGDRDTEQVTIGYVGNYHIAALATPLRPKTWAQNNLVMYARRLLPNLTHIYKTGGLFGPGRKGSFVIASPSDDEIYLG